MHITYIHAKANAPLTFAEINYIGSFVGIGSNGTFASDTTNDVRIACKHNSTFLKFRWFRQGIDSTSETCPPCICWFDIFLPGQQIN